jgi:uncharacterized protein YukE
MRFIRSFLKLLPPLLVLVLAALVALNHQQIQDWLKLRGYQPPADISKLADEDTMTSSAKHIYYINHAQLISSGTQFGQVCPQPEQTIVLGCYQSNENGIYLRTVTDTRLGGVEEVTAAHEMLHGAYERLSQKDKQYIDSLLVDYFNHDLHDQRIIDVMNSYKKTEPNDVVNEMHSVFGTEVANLPPALESYYQRYFTNRSAVTAFAASYEQEFTSRLNQIKILETQLNDLKQQISSRQEALNAQQTQLQADRASLDNLRNSGQIDRYNAQVPVFNQEVEAYNTGVSQLKQDINTYNTLVEQHNQLADELRGLYTSLGTNLSPQAAQ